MCIHIWKVNEWRFRAEWASRAFLRFFLFLTKLLNHSLLLSTHYTYKSCRLHATNSCRIRAASEVDQPLAIQYTFDFTALYLTFWNNQATIFYIPTYSYTFMYWIHVEQRDGCEQSESGITQFIINTFDYYWFLTKHSLLHIYAYIHTYIEFM